MSSVRTPVGWGNETEFEKRRGISRLEIRKGFSQAHVYDLGADLNHARLRVLEKIASIGISIDFLKLTPSGLSFLSPEGRSVELESALAGLTVRHAVIPGRAIVLVHAVNMRDEEGLIAKIARAAIATGAKVDHVSDMHDRMLLVVDAVAADVFVERLSQQFVGGEPDAH